VSKASAKFCWGKHAQVVILCGGLGTRLRSAIPEGVPKSMAKVGEDPFLKTLISYLYDRGARKFVFALGYQAHIIQNYLEHQVWPDEIEFKYSVEVKILGTAGAVVNCADQIQTDDVFVVNGDTVATLDYEKMYFSHKAKGSQITMALAAVPSIERYGVVQLGMENEIIGFEEKSNSYQGPGLINAGIYLFKRQLLSLWTDDRPLSLEQDVLPSYVGKGLSAYLSNVDFIDIGTPNSYEGANDFLQKMKL
jgi:NDP-sugar pyrophosphorylase family protein